MKSSLHHTVTELVITELGLLAEIDKYDAGEKIVHLNG
jgi:hypothetical protein